MYCCRTLSVMIVTLSLLGVALPALAEDPDASEPADPAALKQEAIQRSQANRLKRWDTNGDGVLDEKELASEQEAKKKRIEERKARRASWDEEFKKRRPELFEKYDRDGDGHLNESERAKLRADREAERAKQVADRQARRTEAQAGRKPAGAPSGAGGNASGAGGH